jgi:hypothetical protein
MMKNLRRFGVGSMLALALLVAPFTGKAQTVDGLKQRAREAKVSSDLLTVITNGGIGQQAPVAGLQRDNLFMTSGNSIAIDAVANSEGEGQALLQALRTMGLSDGIASQQRVSGYLPIDKLDELKNISSLKFVRPSYQPIHSVGAVTSQGDTALRSYVARTTYGVDGTGVKVGILSDSYDNKGGAAAGVASGDLPAGVQVLKDAASGGSDEGRGMAELIHDVAPGSPLAFYTAFVSQLDFAAGIRALATAGCKIITDDVSYFAEPFFQDGPIAQSIDDVVNNSGVTYFSSAGNNARTSYQKAYNPTTTPAAPLTLPAGYVSAHNFGGGDIRQSFLLRGGGRTTIISFQWDDPFFSVSGGTGAQTDMDILVYIGGVFYGNLSGTSDNLGGDPLEIVGIRNSGADVTIELVLAKYAGPDPSLVKWVYFGNGVTTTIEYDTKSSTAVGHTNASRCISVGAAAFYNTPAYNGAATATVEGFSSAGGTPVYFTTSGARLGSPVTRPKPEITSVDGGNTTFFGSDSNRDTDAFPNFFGTSAAAPHAAGVAALMKQKVPSITSAAILSTLENTALDMDDPSTTGFDTGFDFGTGYGFIQADRALQALQTVTSTFSITGVTTVSCTTVSAGARMLTFTPQYGGLNGQPVSFSVLNEMLPTTAPGPYSLRVYTDNPVITLKATQSGSAGEASFSYNWLVACGGSTPPPPPPPSGAFSITSVITVNCAAASAGGRMLTFNPQYSGLNGQPVSFSVANEMLPTTAPGPYTLRVYTDNPVITLKATQSGTAGEASFSYNWLTACNGGTPGSARVGAGSELTAKLRATILPNPVSDEFRIRIEGAPGQVVRLELNDVSGHSLVNRSVDVSSDDHQESLRFNQPGRGLYLLRVSTGQQAVTLKVIRE